VWLRKIILVLPESVLCRSRKPLRFSPIRSGSSPTPANNALGPSPTVSHLPPNNITTRAATATTTPPRAVLALSQALKKGCHSLISLSLPSPQPETLACPSFCTLRSPTQQMAQQHQTPSRYTTHPSARSRSRLFSEPNIPHHQQKNKTI
jgi:hypothetical protein